MEKRRNFRNLSATDLGTLKLAVRTCTRQLGTDAHTWYDLLSDLRVTVREDQLCCNLSPYQVSWLTPDK